VVEALTLAPGQRVADLGAGGGYFTFRLAAAVGAGGRVYAADVDQSMTDYLQDEAKDRGVTNVSAVLSAPDDPRLPEPVDLLFTCNTYHHLEDRVAYFTRVREKYLRPGGRVAVIDFRPEAFDHATARDVIVDELQRAGFALQTEHDWLERQSFLVFEVAAAGS
jgi:cyclopropane fatty-acyl-phospholipid synthase-like methyltransferase